MWHPNECSQRQVNNLIIRYGWRWNKIQFYEHGLDRICLVFISKNKGDSLGLKFSLCFPGGGQVVKS